MAVADVENGGDAMTKLQRLIIQRGELVRRYADHMRQHRRKAAATTAAMLESVTRQIIKMELREERKAA